MRRATSVEWWVWRVTEYTIQALPHSGIPARRICAEMLYNISLQSLNIRSSTRSVPEDLNLCHLRLVQASS
jgi:hypothetical protein